MNDKLSVVAVALMALLCQSGTAQTISYKVPHDISPDVPDTIDSQTLAFLELSWQTFVALNWPALLDASGNPTPAPDTTKDTSYQDGKYVTVWEAWIEARDLFLPDGSAPAAWGSEHVVPSSCLSASSNTKSTPRIVLHASSKGGAVLDEFVQAFRMGPVIDSSGEYVRFGINFNETMYDYIVDNKLFNVAGQQAFSASHTDGASFPRGNFNSDEIGAIMVKSSWKILGDFDNADDFHTIPVWIYNPPQPDVAETCRIEEVGLVGFHITHRTNSAPQWAWATFEHVANAPNWAEATGTIPSQDRYSFFDFDSCPIVDARPSCKYNTLPPQPWNPEVPDQDPTMVIRTGNVSLLAALINIYYQEALAGQVWSNYMIIDVQWPTQVLKSASTGVAEVNPAYPYGVPVPTFLANSTMETFIQGFVTGDVTSNSNEVPPADRSEYYLSYPLAGNTGGAPRNSSSCVNCHGDASMTTGVPANFVFSLNRAQSQ